MNTNEDRPVGTGWLDTIERVGNRLPDPALLFLCLLLTVWIASAIFAQFDYEHVNPRTGDAVVINNLLLPAALTTFTSGMVKTFVQFHPLGVVLLAMLGIGLADYTGLIRAGLRALLGMTSPRILTPMLLLIAIVSHSGGDAGYVLVIPLGGVMFAAAGRHPLAGIACAFAGVSGGFSANFVPSMLDPMLQGISQSAAQILNPDLTLNPLNNWFFTSASCLPIVLLGWYITDQIIEPRLTQAPIDVAAADGEVPALEPLNQAERRALRIAGAAMLTGALILVISAIPTGSAWRATDGGLASAGSPLMASIVPLIFLLFVIPGVVYGYAVGTVRSHRDVIAGMQESMSGLAYYIVMAFFAALFIAEFGRSNLGALLALQGAAALSAISMPAVGSVVGVIIITGLVNIFVGSASAKWALLAPILIPMLMELGISPDLTQAAYRVGDSSTNIITPLMPYFPLIVVYCQRYVKDTGIGTVVALMLPFSIAFLVVWTSFLIGYWAMGLPLGLQSSYAY